MTRSSRILKNIASNWVGFAVNAAVTLVLTPIVLRELGGSRYGIWILTSSIVGYYGILDLGFRAGVNQFLTRSVAAADLEQASNIMSTAVVALSLVGAAMAGISVAVAFYLPELISIPAGAIRETFWCVLIIGTTASIQCVFSPFSAVFVAKQRFDLSNAIGISTRLLTALGIFYALRSGYGLIGISLATGGGTILDYAARWYVARKLVPELQVERRRSNFGQLRDIGAFGVWNFLIQVSQYVYLHMQPLVIGFLLPISAVGHYALATGLWFQINGLFGPIGQVLYPAAAEMDVRGEGASIRILYNDGSRLLLLLVIPVVLIAFFWADDFYRLWIGEEYLSGSTYASVADILRVLLIGTLVSYTSNVGGQIVLAAGYIRELAMLQISGAIINISLSLLLIPVLGLPGLAVAAVLATVVVDLVGIPLVLKKRVGLAFADFFGAAWVRLFGVLIISSVIFALIRWVADASDWLTLVFQGLIAGGSAAIIVVLVGLTGEEKRRFIFEPLARLRQA